MNTGFYNKNLAALKRHPATFARVGRIGGRGISSRIAIEPSKCGVPTLAYSEDGSRPVSYHSRYDPVKEAEKQVCAGYTQETHVLLLGFGLGYQCESILRNLKARVGGLQVFVIEPDPEIFVAAMHSRDLSHLFLDNRIAFFVGMSPDEIGDVWSSSLDWTVMDKLAFIDHPPSLSRFKQYFERVVEKVRYLCKKSKGNLVTLMHAGFEFHSNYFANISDSFCLPGIGRLFNQFAGKPVVVVAAGPSLDHNMHMLNNVKGRFPIIAVDTALRQLVANGIKPDIVCAADPSYENSLDFVGVENETDVILAVEAMTHPDILKSFKGPKMLMTFGGGLHPMTHDLREPVGKLVCWGSIATTVFDLARNMGADPIIFIGLDLSFQDGKLHAKGSYSDDLLFEKVHPYTSIEHEAAEYINTRGAYKIVMPGGGILYTDQNMKIYKDWFEDQFRQTQVKIINATEGGIVDRFVELRTFADVIAQYGDVASPVREILDNALQTPVKADVAGLISRLSSYRKIIMQQESRARKAVASSRKLLSSYAEVHPDALPGKFSAEFFDILKLHDDICSEKDIFAWFSIHQTRFMTRHTMELNNLRANQQSLVKDWLKQLLEFFAALEEFIEYQIPLLDRAVAALTRENKSNSDTREKSQHE